MSEDADHDALAVEDEGATAQAVACLTETARQLRRWQIIFAS